MNRININKFANLSILIFVINPTNFNNLFTSDAKSCHGSFDTTELLETSLKQGVAKIPIENEHDK